MRGCSFWKRSSSRVRWTSPSATGAWTRNTPARPSALEVTSSSSWRRASRMGGSRAISARPAVVGASRVVPANGARILLKLESENPTGSMKDRMALAMIEAAEADGRLKPGAPVVEYTAGSTGVSLSLVCAVKGHPLYIVSSDAFAQEKLDHMKILGARLAIVSSEGGGMTVKLTRALIESARVIADKTGALWAG